MRDLCNDALHSFVTKDVRRRNAQHANASFSKPSISARVADLLLYAFVRSSIDFLSQCRRWTIEIKNI
jgi:hypothetical protein